MTFRLGVAGALLSILLGTPRASAQLRGDHPRIYINSATLPTLRSSAPGDPRFVSMVSYVDRSIPETEEEMAALDERLASTSGYNLVHVAALVALITREQRYVDAAKLYLSIMQAYAPSSDFALLNQTRGRLLGIAVAYDWLHEVLTEGERATTRDAIVAYVGSLSDLIESDAYVSSPSRWGNVVSLAGLVAIHGDDARLDTEFERVVFNFENGFNPVLERVGVDGGHHMGWYYDAAYSGVEAYFMWRTATTDGETWVADYLRDDAFFYIYAAASGYRMPVMEDAGSELIPQGARGQLAISSGLFGNGYAESFERELAANASLAPLEPPGYIFRVITQAGAAEPLAINTLPLSRHFSGAGFVVARDSWERATATTLIFKATPFYSLGHHQRDEGSFVIDYRGQLLVDAGYYDGGSGADRSHYYNFYSRSVAHNTLLVRWPEERINANASFENEGGQQVQDSEPRDLAAMEGAYARRGIVGYGDNGSCVWSRADLADTYNVGKLTAYTRDLLEVRAPGSAAHPAIYVLDRTTLPVERPAAILWHFGQAATVTGSRIAASNAGGAQIRLDVLRPANAVFTSYSDTHKWDVNAEGRAYPPTVTDDWPYWGRVEVAPSALSTTPEWSTLIRVGDAELASDATTPIDLSGDGWTGAQLGSTLFAIVSNDTRRIEIPSGGALADGCIAGLDASAMLDVVVDDETLTFVADGNGMVVFSAIPVTPPPLDMGGGQRNLQGSCSCHVRGASRTLPSAWALLFALTFAGMVILRRKRIATRD